MSHCILHHMLQCKSSESVYCVIYFSARVVSYCLLRHILQYKSSELLSIASYTQCKSSESLSIASYTSVQE